MSVSLLGLFVPSICVHTLSPDTREQTRYDTLGKSGSLLVQVINILLNIRWIHVSAFHTPCEVSSRNQVGFLDVTRSAGSGALIWCLRCI